MGPSERILSGEIDVVGDEDELAGGQVGADAPGGVGDDQRPYAEAGEHPDGVDDVAWRIALIGVDASLHDGERRAGEGAEDEPAGVAFDGGTREVRDLGVGDRDGVGEPVGKASKAGA